MSKAKQFAIVSSALLLAGVATASLASGCGTSISQTTATCLSTAATTSFIANYQANLAAEGGNNSSSYSSPMSPSQPTVTQAAPKKENQTTQNNNTNTQKKGINWF